MASEFPAEGMEATLVLVVSDPGASRDFYERVLGAEVFRSYGTSVVLRFLGTWLLLVSGGEPSSSRRRSRASRRCGASSATPTVTCSRSARPSRPAEAGDRVRRAPWPAAGRGSRTEAAEPIPVAMGAAGGARQPGTPSSRRRASLAS